MSETTATARIGPGFLGLLTITFVVLKALGYITWSWWLVFLPIWGPFVLLVSIAGVGLVLYGILTLFEKRNRRHW